MLQKFESAHRKLTLMMGTWDSLDHYQFKVLPILTSRIPVVKKIRIIKKRVKALKAKIKSIDFVIKYGCFLCKENGIVFI